MFRGYSQAHVQPLPFDLALEVQGGILCESRFRKTDAVVLLDPTHILILLDMNDFPFTFTEYFSPDLMIH